jgi:hypothetical protein
MGSSVCIKSNRTRGKPRGMLESAEGHRVGEEGEGYAGLTLDASHNNLIWIIVKKFQIILL